MRERVIAQEYEKLRIIIWTGTKTKKVRLTIKLIRYGRIYADKMENRQN